ncbi:nucleocapsid protein [Guagua virus]|uniref:Nucleocapsid protein n=1 Tax=Guagua virus TaxID=2689370 RepID=A0A6B9KGJ8_9VIRU|nr:nucleocapsid protein [Guagua virus]QHA33855.1 nucleocapsid protein [Guagua virus]
MQSAILKPEAFKVQDVPIVDQWPAAMLQTASELVEVNKGLTYVRFMSQLDGDVKIENIDKAMKIGNVEKPSDALALATYCTSSLWSQNIRGSRGLTAFNLKIGGKSIPVYSLKGEQNVKLDDGMFSVDDAIHSSTIYLNKIVDDFYAKKENTWAMTPLARICITDSNIKELADELDVRQNEVVKSLNICCSRKAYQLYGITKYCSLEMTIAAIMRTSFSANASPTTKSIASKTISKCVNKSGVNGVDTKKVSTILSYMVGSNSGMNMEVDSVMDLARKMAKDRSSSLAKTGLTTTAFKQSSD